MAVEAVVLYKFGPKRWGYEVTFDGGTVVKDRVRIPDTHEAPDNRTYMEWHMAAHIETYRNRKANANAAETEQASWVTFTNETVEAQTVLTDLQNALD